VEAAQLTRFIKEIGRGKNAARDLNRDDAQALFAAMLDGSVPDLQMGAVLMALRIKGESPQELAGFLAACEDSYTHLAAPAGTVPLVIPAYNGARQLPNLTALLAHLVARQGVPVLVHGIEADPGRVTTCEVLAAMGANSVNTARTLAEAHAQLCSRGLAFICLDTLAPALARLLSLRRVMGVRSSGHTLAKMLQPFDAPAVRLVSVTHPEYVVRMRTFFTQHAGNALLLRGAEGEAVAHPRRESVIDWLDGENVLTWCADATEIPSSLAYTPLPENREAKTTADWINEALAGRQPVPSAILHQVACCVRASRLVASRACVQH
jgi:anthranilate phosphoribosyltransferase